MFRRWKMLSLTFLLLTSSCVESGNRTLSMSKVSGNRLLSSHSLHHSSARSLIECVQLCLRRNPDCTSLAYDEDRRMCDLFASIAEYQQVTLVFTTSVLLYEVSPYRDCTDVKQQLNSESGVYQIKPCSSCDAFLAYCDMDTDGKAWTVFQRRRDGSEDFNQTWQSYARGFGDPSGEFWLGNENIYEITSSATYELRIDMIDRDNGNAYHVIYESFEIGSETEDYILDVGDYIDAKSNVADGLHVGGQHQGMKFSTIDRDNDNKDNDAIIHSCATQYESGWWFNRCYISNLNAKYGSAFMIWYRSGGHYLRFSEMKMRRIDQ